MKAAHNRDRNRRKENRRPESPPPARPPERSLRAGYAPTVLAFALVALSALPRMAGNAPLRASFWGAALILLVWNVGLWVRLRDGLRTPTMVFVPRPQHYVQALVQLTVFAYWGWYWRPVYAFAGLVAAQLVFAYAFDMLLTWSRRESYTLGFGPVPIILSINLFLWFRDDWFYLQFLMIGIGFLGKEFVRWTRDGRDAHIFNPSAFTLGLFSLALIATRSTDLTWGQEIASTLTLAPHIYLFLFAVGLVVMYFFSITLVAATAAAVLFALSALYSAANGVPYFLDSEIPAAVFLGLHLLVTDPSTSPRSPLGKALFGALYGLGVFGLYSILGAAGAPTFYDKLLCVPLLNLSVRGVDGLVTRLAKHRPTLSMPSFGGRANLAHMGVWIVFFGVMTAAGRTDGRHPGDSLPFWEQSCSEERPNACARLLQLEGTYCADNSAWACNELGVHYREGRIAMADPEVAEPYLARACELRFQAACLNLLDRGRTLRSPPRTLDLRLLLREGGPNLMDMPDAELYARGCAHGWGFLCAGGGTTG